MHQTFAVAKNGIAALTGLPGYDQSTPTVKNEATTDGAEEDSAAYNVPMYHLQGEGDKSQSAADNKPLKDDLLAVVNALVEILEAEVTTVTNAFNLLKTQVLDQVNSLSLTQIVARILGIIGIVVVETVENLTIGVLNLLSTMIDLIADAIIYEINIPIISWLFRLITGGDNVSMVNVIAFVAAFPITIIYKCAVQETPFPDDEWTNRLIAAPTLTEFSMLLYEKPVEAPGTVGKRVNGLVADLVLGVVGSVGMLVRIGFTWLGEAPSLSDWKFCVACIRWIGRVMTSVSSLINAYEPGAGWAKHLNTTMTITKLCRDGFSCFFPKMEKKWPKDPKVATLKVVTGWWGTGENLLCLVGDVGQAVKEDPINMGSAKEKVIFSVKWVGTILNHCGGALGGPKAIATKPIKVELIIAETVLRSPYVITSTAVPIMQHVWEITEDVQIQEERRRRAVMGPISK